jgi:hypothetical protein
VDNEQALGRRKQTLNVFLGSSLERGWKVIAGADVLDLQRYPQRRSRVLQSSASSRRALGTKPQPEKLLVPSKEQKGLHDRRLSAWDCRWTRKIPHHPKK